MITSLASDGGSPSFGTKDRGFFIFSQSEIASYLRLVVQNSFGENLTYGQLHRPNIPRAVRFCSILPGIGSNFLQFQMKSISRKEGKLPLGMHLRDKHPNTCSCSRRQVLLLSIEVWCIIPSGRDSSFWQSIMSSFLRVVDSLPFGNLIRDGQSTISKHSKAHLVLTIPSANVSKSSQFFTKRSLSMGNIFVSRNGTSSGNYKLPNL